MDTDPATTTATQGSVEDGDMWVDRINDPFHVRVRTNDAWVSIASAPKPDVQTPVTTSPPQASVNPTVTDTSVTLSWTAPSQVAGTLDGYNVYEGSSTTPLNTALIPASTTSFTTTTPLTPGTSYNFVIKAVSTPTGGSQTESAGLTIQATTTGTVVNPLPAPTGVTATAGNATASVAFNLVTGATSYTVTATPGGINKIGSTSPITVDGLANGTSYTFTVSATDGTRTSAESTASGAVVPSGGGGGTANLPARIVSMWHNALSPDNLALSAYPADVNPLFNFVSLGMAQGAGDDGSIFFGTARPQQEATDIRALVASGKHVVLGIGGAGGNTRLMDTTNADVMFNSIAELKTQYGFSGIDFDIENPSIWTPEAMAYLATKLKTEFGQQFIIVLTAALYGTLQTMWLRTAELLGDNYDFMATMLYDFPECTDSRLTDACLYDCNVMSNGGVPDNKIVLGFSFTHTGEPNITPDPQLAIDAYQAVKSTRPNIRGVFVYDDNRDRFGNFGGTRAISAAVLNG